MQVSKESDKTCGTYREMRKNKNEFEMAPVSIMFDKFSSFSIELMSMMIQTIFASFKRVGFKMLI